MATQAEQQALTALISARSLEAVRSAVRQYPLLKDSGAMRVLEQVMERERQAGNTAAYNQLSATRQWLAQIQSER